jgi:magnesium chelatase family protein
MLACFHHIEPVDQDSEFGLPAFTVVGLPDNIVKESRERILTAIRNSGYELPSKKITVNLAPMTLPIRVNLSLIAGEPEYTVDFAELKGQQAAKKALEIAAAEAINTLTLCINSTI